MRFFDDFGIQFIHHYAPLHYLPFIARSEKLLSKPSLHKAGYGPRHLRSMSSRHDVVRGFGDCVFLTIDPHPRILNSKLNAGFPHVAISIPVAAVEFADFSLCRYNVAMTRVLRRGGLPGRPESDANGRYYANRQIPIARTLRDKRFLLAEHLPKKTMIEVLIHGDLSLPHDTKVVCFNAADLGLATKVLMVIKSGWKLEQVPPPGPYNRNPVYVDSVSQFIEQALADPEWRGNNLEFDRI
jgi:hypothetical protein